MATVANAVQHMKHNNTPYWWLYSGSAKVGQYTTSDNLEDSVTHFERSVELLPDGNYRLKSSDKEANHSGAVNFSFAKSGTTQHHSTTMQPVQSNNVYGISDALLSKIQEEARQKIMVEQMHGKFMVFIEEWPEYKKKIDYLYEDQDEDGTPDFLEMTRKASDTVKAASDMKKAFSGGSLFS